MADVTDDTATGASDLRERRRQSTRRDISDTAIELVLDRGLDDVTVDDIAHAAGVSPRTFFNYFASKKAALVPGPEPLSADDVEQFVTAQDEPILDGLRTLFIKHAALSPDIRDGIHVVQRLITAYPQLMPVLHENMTSFEETLVTVIARRLDVSADDERPRVAAAVCSSLLRVAVTTHADDNAGALERDISRSFDALQALLTT